MQRVQAEQCPPGLKQLLTILSGCTRGQRCCCAKAAEYASQITIGRKDREDSVDAKSIMHLLMLAATQGTTLEITAEGPDEAEAAEALAELVRTRFEED